MTDEVYENLTALVASPSSDSLEVEPDTLTQDEGERLLHLYEAEVIDGYAKIKQGTAQAAHALFQILEGGLWMFALDKETGKAFGDGEKPRKEDYVRQLADDIGISRSSAFARQATLRVASNGLQLSVEEMEDVGMSGLDIARGFVDYNREDGKVKSVPGAQIPQDVEPWEHVRQAVLDTAKEVNGEHLKPKDFRRILKEKLGVTEPELTFYAVQNGVGFDIGINYDDNDGHWQKGVIWNYASLEEVPQYVRDEVIRKLRLTFL